MTIKKSKHGNIYLTINADEKKWMGEVSGFEVSEDGKIAFFKPALINSLQDTGRIFHIAVRGHGRNATESELQIWVEMKNLLDARALELKEKQ